MLSPEETQLYIRKLSDILYKENYTNLAAVIAAHPYGIEISPDQYSEIECVELDNKPLIVLFYKSDCPIACRL